MKKFQIFKPGKHTSNSGVSLEFTEAQLRESVAAYDPALHQAPITIGHPRDNLPAYGWIGALSYADDAVDAEPVQLETQFVEMVKDGRFNKRSASWYLPDAAANPTPGKLYLRHVAFLGAQPPSVKGLRALEFDDDGAGTIEFADSVASSNVADLFRNVREWIIGKHGVEAADSVIPNQSVTALESPRALPAFSENKEDEMTITKEQLEAAVSDAVKSALATSATQIADATREATEAKSALAKAQTDFAEQDKTVKAALETFAANERALKREKIGVEIDALVTSGKVLPAARDSLVSFVESLGTDDAIDFGEGDAKKKVSQRTYLLELLTAQPASVDYSERSQASDFGEQSGASAASIAEKAQALVDKARDEGKTMTITQAVFEVSKIRRVA